MSERASGPQWQEIALGARVMRTGARKFGKRGTVVRIEERSPDGVTTFVGVRWDPSRKFAEVWGADCLIVVEEAEEPQ